MNTNVIPFCFEAQSVRVIERDGDPWFVAKDVCDVLEIVNSRKSVLALDEDELVSLKVTSGGQEREMNIISESGLYTLIIRSNKPQARPFRKWVTSEVLPSIRKTGGYALPQTSGDMGGFHTFDYEGKEFVVFVGSDGAPWFRAIDIAKILGYAGLQGAITKICDPRGRRHIHCRKGDGAIYPMVFIDEVSTFGLLIRSSKSGTGRLQRFVSDTVLPSLRASLAGSGLYLQEPAEHEASVIELSPAIAETGHDARIAALEDLLKNLEAEVRQMKAERGEGGGEVDA